jgi:hypothetical protein
MVIESLRRAIRDIHTPHTQPNKHAHVMKHAHEEHMLAFFSLFSLPYETANGGTRTHTHNILVKCNLRSCGTLLD